MSSNLFKNIARSTAKSGLILFLGTFISQIILSLSSIIVGRLLGPENYGLLNLSLTPGKLLFTFTGFGITISLVRFLSISQSKRDFKLLKKTLNMSFFFQVIVSGILSILLFTYASEFSLFVINRPEAAPYVRLTSLWLFWAVIYSTLNNAFYGLDMMKHSSIMSTLQALSRLFIAPTLIVLGYGILGAIVGYILSFFLSSIFGIIFILLYIRRIKNHDDVGSRFNMDWDLLHNMLLLGFPAYFPTIISNFMWVYRNYILSMFTTNFDIGNFSAAFYIYTIFTILLGPIQNTLFPSFSKIDLSTDSETAAKLLRYSIKYTVLAVMPLMFFTMFFSKEVVVVVFGWKYKYASPYLILFLINYLYLGLGRATLPSFFKGIGETKILFKAGLINLVVSAPLYYILMMYFSTPGIILTTVIAGLIVILYQFITAFRHFPDAFDFMDVLPIYAASFITGFMLWFLRQFFSIRHTWGNLFFYFFLYIFVFLVLLPFMRGVSRSDLYNFEAAYRDFPIVNRVIHILVKFEEIVMDLFRL